MKVYLVQGHNDPCSYLIGIFADKQAALEVAESQGEKHEFGCTVSDHDVLETQQQWQEQSSAA